MFLFCLSKTANPHKKLVLHPNGIRELEDMIAVNSLFEKLTHTNILLKMTVYYI